MKFYFWGNIFSSLNGNTPGGGELQVALLAKGLSENGHSVSIIDFGIMEDIKIDDINFISLKKRTKSKRIKFFVFYNMLKKSNADFYYARMKTGMHFLGFLSAMNINETKFILGIASDIDTLSFHDRFRENYIHRGLRRLLKNLIFTEILYRLMLKNADYVIVQHFQQQQNLKKKKIRSEICENIFIKNIFDIEVSDQVIKFSKFFLFLGSLDKMKGIDRIIDIIDECSNLNFVIVGKCRDKYANKKIEIIKHYKNCQYLGQVKHKNILSILGKSEALISVSSYEGFPNSFLESWSQGIPVISLNVLKEVIVDNNLGIYCNGDIRQLEKSLYNFDINSFSKNHIKRYVIKKHSVHNVIKKFLKIIT